MKHTALFLLLTLMASAIETIAQPNWILYPKGNGKKFYMYDNQRNKHIGNEPLMYEVSSHWIQHGGKWFYNGRSYTTGQMGLLDGQNIDQWVIAPEYDELNEIGCLPFKSCGWLAAKKNGQWGVIDVENNMIIIDIAYSFIQADATGQTLNYGGNRIEVAKLHRKIAQAKAAVAEEKARKERKKAEAKALAEKKQQLASFTTYAQKYVQPRMAIWQQKGEFEKVADYTRRVSGENRQRQIDILTREAEAQFLKENRELIDLATLTLNTYDSENEVFALRSDKFGLLLLPVPISEAPKFKQNFAKKVIKNEQYFVENDKFALASFDITVNGKSYRYSNQNALNYSQYQLNPDALDLPSINIVTGQSSASANKPKVSVKLAESGGSNYSSAEVYLWIDITPGEGKKPALYVEINGADAIKLEPLEQTSKGARSVKGKQYRLNLPTEPGKSCYLAFSARDELNITSETQKVEMKYVGQVIKPRLILFAVGVGDYTSGDLPKLTYAAKDARDFASTIEQSNLEDYSEFKKHILIDKQATRSNINKGIREVLDEARGNDVVMFYFSGHGERDGEETYFMTINASREAPNDEGVSFRDLKNNMKKLVERQSKVLIFMDACYSGAMRTADRNSKSAAPNITELRLENAIEFYSSTASQESAEDKNLSNGIFTAGLIRGLRGEAANKDGYITANTLRTYLVDYVGKNNSKQTPVVAGWEAGDITIFRIKK